MKKIGCLLMISLLMFGLFGCDKNDNESDGLGEVVPPIDEPSEPTPVPPTPVTPVPTPTNPTVEGEVSVDYENLTIYVPSGRNLKIAQFADLHFSKPGSSTYSNDKEERTIAFMQQVVTEGNPDLIVLSGDNLFGKSENNEMTGVENLQRLIKIMESLETPYAFIYGNHDSEELTKGCSKKELNDYLLNCDAKYLLYGNECPETTGTDYRDIRYGTYTIKICDKESKKLTGALFMFDSGYYDARISSYSSITPGQISWYESKVSELQAQYEGNGVIPSAIFNHIQLPEYATAYITKYVSENPNIVNDSQFKEFNVGSYVEEGRKSEYVIYQDLTPYQMYQVAHGGPTTNVGMFDKMVSLGSTKAYFCGHAHRFTLQVKMDGIVLGFAPQTGFAPAEDINWDARMGYIYNFNSNFDLLNTDVIQEDESAVLGNGLAVKYMDTTNGDSVYTVPTLDDNGNYVYTVTMKKKWSRIKLYVDGEVVNLSGDNSYSISGDFSSTYVTNGKLYNENGGPILFFSLDGPTQYKIIVNPTDKTVHIDQLGNEEVEVPEGSLVVDKVNADAGGEAISLWTTAGYEFKKATNSTVVSDVQKAWLGNNWRLFVVCDSEGKIAYMVLFPAQGYGCPTDLNLYYYHSSYSDYKNNPAIKLSSDFASWQAGSGNHNLFSIVIPEGGFAITSHGAGVNSVLDLLGVDHSAATTDDLLLKLVNTPKLLNDNIRLSYNTSNNTVSVSK